MTKSTEQTHAFQNPDLPIEERITHVISLLTLEEKIACLSTNPSVPRLGIRGSSHIEGLHGVSQGGPANWARKPPVTTTTFPQAIGMAQTWDVALMQEAAQAQAIEARYIFQNPKYGGAALVIRAPNADLGRDPRWGRTEECFGEDAFFNGTMVVAFVKGLQGDHPRYLLTASLMKHFLANSNEDGRDQSSSDFDERLFHEYYSAPFRRGVMEANAQAYMAAYNAYNGIPCHVHPVLQKITRDQWGLDGIICTDGGGMGLLYTHHKWVPDLDHAAAKIIQAGIGQFLDRHVEPTRNAIKRGILKESEIDHVLRYTFRVMIRLGLLDPPEMVPYSKIGTGPEPWLSEKNHSLVRRATQRSIVLLKNSNNLLPLDRNAIKSIAVIGVRGGEVLLDWYSGLPPYTVTPLQGIRNKVPDGVSVRFAAGLESTWHFPGALEMARAADVAIVCLGNHPTCNAGWEKSESPSQGKEAVDRKAITLDQEDLLQQVLAVNPRTILVLFSSFPYAINWSQEHVPAIVQMAHNSQETGNALADVLFGDYNPAGRLVQTWPKSLDDLPPMMDYNLRNGRTYMYCKAEPLYPFGFGLSYTTFEYSNLKTSGDTLAANGAITVSVDVANTGKRNGEEVVQIYARFLDSKVERPIKQLCAFTREEIPPGKTKTISLIFDAKRLAYWDSSQGKFVVEPGKIELMVGASCADMRLKKSVQVFA